jgi:hypothetical protein
MVSDKNKSALPGDTKHTHPGMLTGLPLDPYTVLRIYLKYVVALRFYFEFYYLISTR